MLLHQQPPSFNAPKGWYLFLTTEVPTEVPTAVSTEFQCPEGLVPLSNISSLKNEIWNIGIAVSMPRRAGTSF